MCVCLRVSTCEIFHNEKPTRKNLIERTHTHTTRSSYTRVCVHVCMYLWRRERRQQQRWWRRRRLRNFPSLCFMLALPALLLCDSASLADDASPSSQRPVVVIYRFHRSPTLATVTSPQNPLAEHLYLRSRCCRLASSSESFISESERE